MSDCGIRVVSQFPTSRPNGEAAASVIVRFDGQRSFGFQDPAEVFVAKHIDQVPAVLRAAEAAARRDFWVVGFLSYEAAPAFDAAFRVHPDACMPLAWFAAFDGWSGLPAHDSTSAPTEWSLAISRDGFCGHVERIREEIAAGRTYQTNYTTRLTANAVRDPLALYHALSAAQGDGYHAYLDTGDFIIACASPELFFEKRDRRIRTKPMKGTRPRGGSTRTDARLAEELAKSEKDRAENLMIVDLLRNDLGRIAETGSVQVTSLYDVERFRTVHQMTSTITATLRNDADLFAIFNALFPCGSVTGAPKVSTMQLISELEDAPREVYCGALGIIEPGGENATFCVPIRTVWIERNAGTAVYGCGAGITYDSAADAEYQEVLAKAAVLNEAWPQFDLLETMRIEKNTIVRQDRHLERLLSSARYFAIPADEARIRAALAELRSDEAARIRLLLSQSGTVRTELLPINQPASSRIALAQTAIASGNRFLFHKTTNRALYETHYRRDLFDVLLWNERGEVTEFTRGNVVIELNGERVTPALDCGLLPGVFRQELLDQRIIREARISIAEAHTAARIWFVNSLREWVPVHF